MESRQAARPGRRERRRGDGLVSSCSRGEGQGPSLTGQQAAGSVLAFAGEVSAPAGPSSGSVGLGSTAVVKMGLVVEPRLTVLGAVVDCAAMHAAACCGRTGQSPAGGLSPEAMSSPVGAALAVKGLVPATIAEAAAGGAPVMMMARSDSAAIPVLSGAVRRAETGSATGPRDRLSAPSAKVVASPRFGREHISSELGQQASGDLNLGRTSKRERRMRREERLRHRAASRLSAHAWSAGQKAVMLGVRAVLAAQEGAFEPRETAGTGVDLGSARAGAAGGTRFVRRSGLTRARAWSGPRAPTRLVNRIPLGSVSPFQSPRSRPSSATLPEADTVVEIASYVAGAHTASVPASGLYRVWGSFQGREALFLIDTGATANCVAESFVRRCGLRTVGGNRITFTMADGTKRTGKSALVRDADFLLAEGAMSDAADFLVAPIGTYDAILGMPWLKSRDVTLRPDNWVALGPTRGGCVFQARAAPVGPLDSLLGISQEEAGSLVLDGAAVLLFFVADVHEGPQQSLPSGVSVMCTDPEERKRVVELISEFADVCPEKLPDGLPPIRGHEHGIDLVPGGSVPYRPPMRLPLAQLQELRRQIGELVRTGRLVPSKSPFGAPVFLVAKGSPAPGGRQEWRMVTDFRGLNEITVKDRTMMPSVQELIDQLREARYFSSFDAHSGYHQIRLRAGDEDKTAISTPFGHFNFTVMPFGLVNAGATYSAMMTDLLRDRLYKDVVNYLDDTLLFSRTFNEHIIGMRRVLEV